MSLISDFQIKEALKKDMENMEIKIAMEYGSFEGSLILMNHAIEMTTGISIPIKTVYHYYRDAGKVRNSKAKVYYSGVWVANIPDRDTQDTTSANI